ncbi:unnamed protein product, partial [Ixodes pacificus]
FAAITKAENGTEKPSSIAQSPAVKSRSKSWFRKRHTTQKPNSTKTHEEDNSVINISVEIDEVGKDKEKQYGDDKSINDYTLLETNVSISNPGKVDHVDKIDQSQPAQPSAPTPMRKAHKFESSVCFQLVHGEDGKASVIPCHLTSSSATSSSSASLRRHQVRGKARKSHSGPKSVNDDEEAMRTDRDGLQPCRADEDCNLRASCLVHHGTVHGRCVCDAGYLGNGLFCWEQFLDR